jgi:hypothetical protein
MAVDWEDESEIVRDAARLPWPLNVVALGVLSIVAIVPFFNLFVPGALEYLRMRSETHAS